jgi:predicted double-glycine peptidase
MNAIAATAIPYEKQSDQQTNRACGAACLSMVYRSYGKDISQAQIWQAIAKPNRFGSLSSTTHLMAGDALNRGFGAVAIQARHPLQALRICQQSDIRVILNHRLKHDVATGHYSVLVGIDDKNVVLHDPFYGPSRRLSHAELLELWQPRFPSCEIVGNALIGVLTPSPPIPACQLCCTPFPSNVECPKCKKPVGLQPIALLGCMSGDCMARMWNYICCPSCDYTWTFSLHPPQASARAGTPDASRASKPVIQVGASSAPALDVNKLFGEVDKFCAHILGIPGAANHPEIKKQLDHITASKEKFKLAYAEQLAHGTMLKEHFAAIAKKAKEQKEATRKRIEELNTPSPPLDGNALGHALLKNLGFDGLNMNSRAPL